MISPWVKGSSARAFRYHWSLTVIVPELSATAKNDFRLPLGQFVQDEHA